MNLTPQEREKIYLEERARHENSSSGSGFTPILAILTVGAALGLGALIMASMRNKREVKLEDLRKAYSGLSPEDEI